MPNAVAAATDPVLRPWYELTETGPVPGPSTLTRITNAPSISAELALQQRGRAVHDALVVSGAPQTAGLLHMLDTAEPHHREDVVTALEQAIARGYSRGDLAALKNLLLNMANVTLDGLRRSTLALAWPAAGTAVATAQLAKAVYAGSWQGVAAGLPALAAMLPSVRNSEAMDALIRSLPRAWRDGLQQLHDALQETDASLRPSLDIRQAGPAVAVAVLLWYLQSRLPPPTQSLQGLRGFLANLPRHWKQLTGMNELVGGVFAPTAHTAAAERREERAERIAQKRWADVQHLPGHDEPEPVIHALQQAFPRQSPSPALPFERFAVPGPQTGGPIQAPPAGPADARSAAPGTGRSNYGLMAWFAGALGVLRPFQQVPQEEPGGFEMVDLGPDAIRDVEAQPLRGGEPAAAAVALGRSGLLKRGLLYTGITAAGSALGYGLYRAGEAIHDALWPAPPQGAPLTPTQLAEALAHEVVSVEGNWGTGLDLLLGTPSLPGARSERATDDELATTPLPDTMLAQLGISDAQREQLLDDEAVVGNLLSLQTWSLAIAAEVAAQPGWQWVAQLPASEQELLVSQLHILQGLDATLSNLEAVPTMLLNEALRTAGWSGSADRMEVDLGPTTVAGVTVQQRMPLREYCLLRADGKQPDKISFLHDGIVVEGAQHRTLTAFIAGTGCTQLQTRVTEHGESLREPLKTAVRARLVIDALKAKNKGDLGSGRNDYLRGADIVLAYLQGGTDVESTALTYTDTLADGSAVSIRVPNYLLLRSTSADPAVNGQVVLYRADLARFEIFDNEKAFRQFLDKQRAGSGLPFVDRKLDRTLMDDIVAAAPPALQAQVRERVSHWEERQAMFQSGKGGQQAWNAQDAFVLDFKPVTEPGHALGDWAGVLVTHGQQREQQRLAGNRLRWSPLGIANADSEARHQQGLKDDVQTVQAFSHPAVTRALTERLSRLGFAMFAGLDPAQVELQLPGSPAMNLVDWAVNGWQQHGLKRAELPVNLPDLPDGPGLPMQSLPNEAWPSDDDLFGMRFTAYTGNDTRVIDERLTEQLQDADVQRAICSELDDFAQSNRLADAYLAHLRGIADNKAHSFHTTLADRIVTHSLWMIETAHQQGQLDATAYAALKAAHARLVPGTDGVSSLETITLGPHEIPGVWSLEAAGTHYVFLTDTRAGDQLLDEKAFRRWLVQPGDEARSYVLNHAPLRHHDSLNAMFDKKQSANGIRLGFGKSKGPQEAASDYIQMRISNVDETTVSKLERVVEGLKLFGSAVAALSCSFASGGTLAALCVSSTLALLADSIRNGLQLLERNDIDGAIMEFGGGLADALDVTGVTDLPRMLFQLGRRGLTTVKEATEALGQWRAFNARFNRDGQISERVLLPSRALSASAQPMLMRALPGGGVVFEQGDQLYVKQGQRFAPVIQKEGESHLRLLDPASPGQAGPPLEYRNGRWQKRQGDASFIPTTQHSVIAGPTTPPSVLQGDWVSRVPEADKLPPDKLNELEVVFGIGRRGARITPDLRQRVRDIAMQERIDQIIQNPDSLGLPGDEAITIRAWADSPLLGNGRIVETFVMEHGERYTGVRIGSGPTGMSIQVSDPRQLPDVNRLIDESDIDALHRRLGLPEDADRSLLLQKVREEIARTIAANQTQVLKTWRAVLQKFNYMPTAVDNLLKHFPQLLREEAEILIKSNPSVQQNALAWDFRGDLAAQVADFLAERNMRQQRESVLKGEFDSPSKVIELNKHLQKVLPEHKWQVQSGSSGEGNALSFRRKDDSNNVVRVIDFEPDGKVHIKGPDTDENVSSWEQGIYQLLSPHGKQTVADSTALRNSVLNNMRETPVAGTCAVPRKTGGKLLVKKGLDCDVPPGIELTQDEVATMNQVAGFLQQSHVRAHDDFANIRTLRIELEDIRKAKKVGKLTAQQESRLAELSGMVLMHDSNFRLKNFVTYFVKDLSVNGKPVEFSLSFPAQGAAYSGNSVDWINGFVGDVPMRRVFMADADVAKGAKGKGKQRVEFALPSGDVFRSDYFMGADLTPTTSGRGNSAIELTESDLGAQLPVPDQPGTTKWTPFSEMGDAQLGVLEPSTLTPPMRAALGDFHALPSNLRNLKPGKYWPFEIRSCSEGKVMELLSGALIATDPTLAGKIKSPVNTPMPEVRGTVTLVSDMHPCETSCHRRLKAMMEVLPNVNFRVYYHFVDNKERTNWFKKIQIDREVKRTQPEWDSYGKSEEEVRVELQKQLDDRNDPSLRNTLDDELMRHPPTPEEMPAPKLWLPDDTVNGGL